jgi:hypothetical protein
MWVRPVRVSVLQEVGEKKRSGERPKYYLLAPALVAEVDRGEDVTFNLSEEGEGSSTPPPPPTGDLASTTGFTITSKKISCKQRGVSFPF